jgi:hypothetical protein
MLPVQAAVAEVSWREPTGIQISIYHCIHVHTCTYQYVLVCTSIYQYIPLPVYTSTYKYIPVYTGMYWYVLAYTGTYYYNLMFPLKTVGMHAPSSSSSAICVLLADGSLRTRRTTSALMTSCTPWSFSARLRSLTCSSMDQCRTLGSSNCTSLAPYRAFMWLQLTAL